MREDVRAIVLAVRPASNFRHRARFDRYDAAADRRMIKQFGDGAAPGVFAAGNICEIEPAVCDSDLIEHGAGSRSAAHYHRSALSSEPRCQCRIALRRARRDERDLSQKRLVAVRAGTQCDLEAPVIQFGAGDLTFGRSAIGVVSAGAGNDLDIAAVDLGGPRRILGVDAERTYAQFRIEDDARGGIDAAVRGRAEMAREIFAITLRKGVDVPPELRHAFGVHRMLRRRRSLLRHALQIGAAREGHADRIVQGAHDERKSRSARSMRPQLCQCGAVRCGSGHRGSGKVPGAFGLEVILGQRVDPDHVLVGFARRVAECDHAVESQDKPYRFRRAALAKHRRALPGQFTSRMAVGHERREFTIELGGDPFDVLDVGGGEHAVRMRMFDVGERQRRMQHGFDGGAGRGPSCDAAVEQPHHFGGCRRLVLGQTAHAIEVERGEV